MFGEISSTFGRNWLVSTFMPTGLLFAGNVYLWLRLTGGSVTMFLESLGSATGIALLVGIVLTSLFLGIVQIPLTRILEGYHPNFFRNAGLLTALLAGFFYWRNSTPGAWVFSLFVASALLLVWALHDPLKKRAVKLFLKKKAAAATDLQARYELFRSYPASEDLVLATRLGNRIRAFESHAACYNIDPITGWFRLQGVIPAEYQEKIAAAEAYFYGLVNLTAILALLSVEYFGVATVQRSSLWAASGLLCAILGYAAYWTACFYAAGTWGEYVRSAFDLYRLELLRQMRIVTSVTLTHQQERDLWYQVQQIPIFGTEDKAPDVFLCDEGPNCPK